MDGITKDQVNILTVQESQGKAPNAQGIA